MLFALVWPETEATHKGAPLASPLRTKVLWIWLSYNEVETGTRNLARAGLNHYLDPSG